jgi:hypothetical protein
MRLRFELSDEDKARLDMFAAMALQGLLAANGTAFSEESLAEKSFRIGAAMLDASAEILDREDGS